MNPAAYFSKLPKGFGDVKPVEMEALATLRGGKTTVCEAGTGFGRAQISETRSS